MIPPRPVLAFDFGSPRASAGVALAGRVLARRETPREEGARDPLRLLDDVLADAALAPRALGGVIALAGPGSFTGVRVACAAAQALALAGGIPAAGFPTLAALALAAPFDAAEVLSLVDALRGEWFVQRYGPPAATGLRPALGPPGLWRPGDPAPAPAAAISGFGAARFPPAAVDGAASDPESLAVAVAVVAAKTPNWPWDAALLARPLHLREPATTRPRS